MTGSPRPLSALLGTLGLATLLSGCATTAPEAKPTEAQAGPSPAIQAQPVAAEPPDAGDVRTTTAGGSASCSAR